eukprot:3413639-Amphidinium_carterae.1
MARYGETVISVWHWNTLQILFNHSSVHLPSRLLCTSSRRDMNRSDDSADLRKELAKAKMDKRLLMMKTVVSG